MTWTRTWTWTWTLAACSGGADWIRPSPPSHEHVTPADVQTAPLPDPPPAARGEGVGRPTLEDDDDPYGEEQARVSLRLRGSKRAEPLVDDPTLFYHSYYDFPVEPDTPESGPTRTIFDAQCRPIRTVSQGFHDSVCVQGSGRLHTGETVSFAKRDCACAAECPRTGQRICFEALDRKRFPFGRGATGRAITPLRTVAVDTDVIALGTVLYIPDFHGLRDLGGRPHDGCFVAEDRGLKVKGRHVDVFTGNARLTSAWNAAVPTGRGVRVFAGASRCDGSK